MTGSASHTCTFTLEIPDPKTAKGPSARQEKMVSSDDLGVWDGAWHCPRAPLDGFEKCVFHLPLNDRPDDVNISQEFLEHLERANNMDDYTDRQRFQQFIGATFDEFLLRGRVVGSNDRSYIDLRHCTFYNVDCSRAEFTQRLRFSHSSFTTPDGHKPAMANPSDATEYGDIESILFKSVDFRYNTDFSWCTFEDPARFHGNQYDRYVSFKGADFQGPVDFEMAEFDRMAAFWRASFRGGARMNATKFNAYAWFSDIEAEGQMFWYAARFRNDADFDGATFTEPVTFEEAAFDYTADFSNVTLTVPLDFTQAYSETLLLTPITVAESTYVTFCRAEIQNGKLGQPDTGGVVYDLTDATLGHVLFTGQAPDGLLNWLRFYRTRYDGFDFSDSDDLMPVKTNYCIHTLTRDAAGALEQDLEDSHSNLVTTYLYAKNAANEAGDSVAAGSFFYREMVHRRKEHWDRVFSAGRSISQRFYDLSQWGKNGVMSLTTGYGEHPDRVIYSSMAVIGLFASLYASTEQVLGSADYMTALLFSLQSFVTLILGDVPGGTNQLTKLLSATEGFLGAFFIALFVFTLTRGIHR